MTELGTNMIWVFAGITVFILLFIILREFIAWYYKVNQRIELLESILKEIQLLNINIKHN